MSELSEKLRDLLRVEMEKPATSESKIEHDAQGIRIELGNADVQSLPGFSGMKEHYDAYTNRVIRRCFRKNAGSAAFKDPLDALNRTISLVVPEAISMVIQALADGIQIGQESSFSYKKYRMLNRLEEVFEAKNWRNESSLIALPIEADTDVVEWLSDFISHSAMHLCAVSGYGNNMHDLSKIWDAWNVSLNSTVIGMFMVGKNLGSEWQQETVLNGIIAASKEEKE